MKKNLSLSVLFVGIAVALSGCATKEGSETVLVQPRIEGRVVDADTQMPIKHVVIVRNPQASVPGDENYVSAGEVLEKQETIYSNGDGEFKVPPKNEESDGERILDVGHPEVSPSGLSHVFG